MQTGESTVLWERCVAKVYKSKAKQVFMMLQGSETSARQLFVTMAILFDKHASNSRIE